MHLLFVDESGTPPKPTSGIQGYFVIAGLVIPEDRWLGMNDKLSGLKLREGYRGEVKWRFFAPNNHDTDNPMREWPQDRRNRFRDDIFSIIIDTKSCRVIACASESLTAYNLGNVNTQDDLYFRTYKPVTERFQYLLQDITRASGRDTFGMIVADHRGKGDDDSMRHRHERLIRESGQYTSQYKNFIEGLFFAPSHLSVGIQLVDMIAGAIWRAQAHNDRTWYDRLRPSFRASPTGRIDGYGLVRFPKAGWQGPVLD
ncbi:hypothetical protein M2337_001130 [Sphingobium sp. B2D3A]|uniref:DUF3800 domain-containing protein n=1 Tax=unclassified Sphingobium TaxID=2611147 RepID=UPI0022249C9F|nr:MULTISPECIES: DUF3800 domain-containing protein [unclassified Sphingobium]MCW2336897.1 hypothetical protein [Sphingobium sp. B2D3A]MCW2386651.1 hypothetical protein [Sphingobium sp. B2D3D]